MGTKRKDIEKIYQTLSADAKEMLEKSVLSIVSAKKEEGKWLL